MPDDPARVVIIGDVFDDIIVTPVSAIRHDTDTVASIERRAGGSAANTAAWLASFGRPVDFVGRTNAADTQRHGELLRRSGVTPHLVGEGILPTGTIVVIVEQGRQATDDAAARGSSESGCSSGSSSSSDRMLGVDIRTMLTERGANANTSPADVTDDLLAAAGHLHFTGYTLFSGQPLAGFTDLIARAKSFGLTVSVDPGSAGFLFDHGAEEFYLATAGTDMLFPNLDEARALTGLDEPDQMLDALTARFGIVALTLGRRGALLGSRDGTRVLSPCVAAEARDTTGAGDAFNAGFLASFLAAGDAAAGDSAAGDDVTAALETRLARAGRVATTAAACAVQLIGARPAPAE